MKVYSEWVSDVFLELRARFDSENHVVAGSGAPRRPTDHIDMGTQETPLSLSLGTYFKRMSKWLSEGTDVKGNSEQFSGDLQKLAREIQDEATMVTVPKEWKKLLESKGFSL